MNYNLCCCNGTGLTPCPQGTCNICCNPPPYLSTPAGTLPYVKSGFHGGGDAQYPAPPDGLGPPTLYGANMQTHWYGYPPTDPYHPLDTSHNQAFIYINCSDEHRGLNVGWIDLEDGPDVQWLRETDVTRGNGNDPPNCHSCTISGFLPAYPDFWLQWNKVGSPTDTEHCDGLPTPPDICTLKIRRGWQTVESYTFLRVIQQGATTGRTLHYYTQTGIQEQTGDHQPTLELDLSSIDTHNMVTPSWSAHLWSLVQGVWIEETIDSVDNTYPIYFTPVNTQEGTGTLGYFPQNDVSWSYTVPNKPVKNSITGYQNGFYAKAPYSVTVKVQGTSIAFYKGEGNLPTLSDNSQITGVFKYYANELPIDTGDTTTEIIRPTLKITIPIQAEWGDLVDVSYQLKAYRFNQETGFQEKFTYTNPQGFPPINYEPSKVAMKNFNDGLLYFSRLEERLTDDTEDPMAMLCCLPPSQVHIVDPQLGQDGAVYDYTTFQFVGDVMMFYYGPLFDGKYLVALQWKCQDPWNNSTNMLYYVGASDAIALLPILCKEGRFGEYKKIAGDKTFAKDIYWDNGILDDHLGDADNNFCCKTCSIPPAQINGLPFYKTHFEIGSGLGSGPDELDYAQLQHGVILHAYTDGYNWVIMRKRCNLGIFQSADILQSFTENPDFSYDDRIISGANFCKILGMYTEYSLTCSPDLLYQGLILTDTSFRSSVTSYHSQFVQHIDCSNQYIQPYSSSYFTWDAAVNKDHLNGSYIKHCKSSVFMARNCRTGELLKFDSGDFYAEIGDTVIYIDGCAVVEDIPVQAGQSLQVTGRAESCYECSQQFFPARNCITDELVKISTHDYLDLEIDDVVLLTDGMGCATVTSDELPLTDAIQFTDYAEGCDDTACNADPLTYCIVVDNFSGPYTYFGFTPPQIGQIWCIDNGGMHFCVTVTGVTLGQCDTLYPVDWTPLSGPYLDSMCGGMCI